MRIFEIVIALIAALVIFAAIKLIGFVIQVAIFGAVVGLVAGFFIARMLRRRT